MAMAHIEGITAMALTTVMIIMAIAMDAIRIMKRRKLGLGMNIVNIITITATVVWTGLQVIAAMDNIASITRGPIR